MLQNIICGYLELLHNFLEVSDQSSILLFTLICDYLMIVLVLQFMYSEMRQKSANSESEGGRKWVQASMGYCPNICLE
jgi:hypothetical protein